MTPFIPAWLDDLGLTPTEFRVLCNLWRRSRIIGGTRIAFPGSKNIVKTCRISRDTLWVVLRALEQRQLVSRAKQGFGKPNRYALLVPKLVQTASARPAETTGRSLAETDDHHLAASAGQLQAENNGRQGDQEKDHNSRGRLEGVPPLNNWLSRDEQTFIVRTLDLNPAHLGNALQAFLDYKRPYPADPRDAMAIVRFFHNHVVGKRWMQQMNSRPEIPEPPQWRDILRRHSPESSYLQEPEKPWSEFSAQDRQTICALVRQFVLIAPTPNQE